MDIYYRTAKTILRIYQRILSQDSHVSGELPFRPGAKIIAANHPNATDAFFLPFLFQEKLHFFIQWDLFSLPVLGWILSRCDQIPVWPGRKQEAVELAGEMLGQGKTVVIFPEAQLNPDGRPVKVKTGAVRLSIMTGAPIIPVGFFVPAQFLRTFKMKKKDSPGIGHWQVGGHCYIRAGAPWLPGKEMSGITDETALRDLTVGLMEKIEALTRLAKLEYANENHLCFSAESFNG